MPKMPLMSSLTSPLLGELTLIANSPPNVLCAIRYFSAMVDRAKSFLKRKLEMGKVYKRL